MQQSHMILSRYITLCLTSQDPTLQQPNLCPTNLFVPAEETMATKPELRPARADSVIGITSLSDSFRMAHDLQAAIASFASGDGLHRLSMLTDKIPELEKDVEERDNRISQLAAQLATEQENHSTYNRKQLDTYNGQYDAWKVKEASLQGTTEKLQKELEARDKKISTLEMEREELKAKGREVAEKFRASSNNMKEKEQEIKRLKQLVTEAQGNVISYSKQLSDLQTRTTMLEKSSKAYKMENETNKAECNAYKDRLSQVLSFSVTLEELNLEDTYVARNMRSYRLLTLRS
jgi:DNA repair exonuclease SbcCD ATPase subunit